jgi:mono/diheme cytochrome c family protein
MRNSKGAFGLLVSIALTLIAESEIAKADARRGRALAEQWCSECHAIAPNDPTGNPAAPDFADIAKEPSATAYTLRIFLRVPHATMPNFILDAGDIDDIVGYIVRLKRHR